MSEPTQTEEAEGATAPTTGAPSRRPLATWQRICLAIAVLSVVVGFGLSFADSSGGSGGAETAADGTPLPGAQGFIPGITTPPPSGSQGESTSLESNGLGDWSPFFVKGGFSFFVGFSIGYALRAFFKVSAVAFGILFLILTALSYYGVIEIDWDKLSDWYDTLIAHLRGQFSGMKEFLLGSLPSATLGATGLAIGFKRS